MRLNVKTSLVALACLLSGFVAKAQDEGAIKMLKQFYTSYITEEAKNDVDEKKINLLKKKYCTTALLNKLKHMELDADPFVHAQDYDATWINTLSVRKDAKLADVYHVSYLDAYAKEKNTIKVQVVKEGNSYKIAALQ
ncbi:DUF3828 domain-containing protein [Chitinophaga qingshengii]|uniref:DUF3828 domain-containing protein n=1 Tax=Chitinophaga qingshengii TaxID=1569794 RepID=A0ABR7TWV6_9BACT|nr:DUF3828 domain-containing protein [Chitinophaga qingshengii]MBC9934150.1 DUF3828 domain-containing protein [Chitinophaga qingshengii]